MCVCSYLCVQTYTYVCVHTLQEHFEHLFASLTLLMEFFERSKALWGWMHNKVQEEIDDSLMV